MWLLLKICWSLCRMVGLLVFGLVFTFSPLLAVVVWVFMLIVFLIKYAPTQPQSSPQDQKITQQIEFWQAQLVQQPTDRDILLNLGNLYAAEGNQAQAEHYLRQAQEVDPNFQF